MLRVRARIPALLLGRGFAVGAIVADSLSRVGLRFVGRALLRVGGRCAFLRRGLVRPRIGLVAAAAAAAARSSAARRRSATRALLRAAARRARRLAARGTASTDIYETGKAMVHGEYWSARARSPIKQGSRIRVVKLDGLNIEVEAETEG